MGRELKSLFQLDTRKLVWLIGITFFLIITLQYLELPYGSVLYSTLFPSDKVSVEGQSCVLASAPSSAKSGRKHNVARSIGLEFSGTYTGNETTRNNKFSEGKGTDLNNDVISETDMGLNKSSTFGEGSKSPNESSTKELVELNKNSTVEYPESSKNNSTAEEAGGLSRESKKDGNTTSSNSLKQAGAVNETANEFVTSKAEDRDYDSITEEVGLQRSSIVDKAMSSYREPSIEEFEDLNKNYTVDYAENSNNMTVAEEASTTDEGSSSKNDTIDINTSNNNIGNKNITLSPLSTASPDIGVEPPFPALLPPNFIINTTLEKDVEMNIRTPVVSTNSSISLVEPHVTPSFDKDKKSEEIQNNFTSSGDVASRLTTPEMKEKPEMPPALTTIADMNNLFYQSRISYNSRPPRWSSVADEVLLNARLQIENAPIVKNDLRLYAPLYRNVSMFKRSYELMESTLKVYVYKEGKRPILHAPFLKGIYASEGWFMKQLEANEKFVTKNPREAHLFYLPFSSRMLEETLYVPDSHSHKNLIEYLKNYVDMITEKYSFWNRTEGADHFLVACHDWAPVETKDYMANCIRALCNADVREGYVFGKDVSLPETYVRNPQKPLRDIGGKPPSKRSILAFFAGKMHGYLRPTVLQQWGNKDPDMKIYGKMHNVKKAKINYVQYMKSSKYCLCPRGYEVNSPRVVEAIFYECVPVIISDNFVPPFFEVLNWESFAVFVLEKDIPNLKTILLSIPEKRYRQMQLRVKKIQQHFLWHPRPEKYDIFHMILHSVWYNRVFQIKHR